MDEDQEWEDILQPYTVTNLTIEVTRRGSTTGKPICKPNGSPEKIMIE